MLTVTVLCLALIIWIVKRYQRMSLLRRCNIPGPPPNLLLGNTVEIAKKGMGNCFDEWTRKYGKVVTFYMGGHPNILVTDTDLLREIQIRNFNSFSDRNDIIKGGPHATSAGQRMLTWQEDDDWKQSRLAIAQFFSPFKLKLMIDVVKKNINETMKSLNEQCSKEFDIVKPLRTLSFTNAVETQLSVRVNVDQDSPLRAALEEAVKPTFNGPICIMQLLFPELEWFLWPLRKLFAELGYFFQINGMYKVFAYSKYVLDQRKKIN